MAREYGLKFALSLTARTESNFRAVTLTLPYAGAIRIRFEGLPGFSQALSLPSTDTPSIKKPLTEGLGQVKSLLTHSRGDEPSVLETNAGVTDNFAHLRHLAGVVVLEKASTLYPEGIYGKEQHCCRHDAAHADVLFFHGIEQPLRI